MKITQKIYTKRMLELCREIERVLEYPHDPEDAMRTRLQIKEWATRSLKLVQLAYNIPEPAHTLVRNDAGYQTALAVMLGETKFYVCKDCSFPVSYFDVHPDFDCHCKDCKPRDACPICGDNISDITITIR